MSVNERKARETCVCESKTNKTSDNRNCQNEIVHLNSRIYPENDLII